MRSVEISSLMTAGRLAQQFSEPTLVAVGLGLCAEELIDPTESVFTLSVLLFSASKYFVSVLSYMTTHTYSSHDHLEVSFLLQDVESGHVVSPAPTPTNLRALLTSGQPVCRLVLLNFQIGRRIITALRCIALHCSIMMLRLVSHRALENSRL